MSTAQQKQHSRMLAKTIKANTGHYATARSWSHVDGGDARDTINGNASVYRGQFREPDVRIHRKEDSSRDISKNAFRAGAGRSHHGLFSTFEYQHGRPSTHPQGQDKKDVDRDGCPLTTHRGLTTFRHRIPANRMSIGAGSGVPSQNAKMNGEKEWEWMPNPHVQPHISTLYRRMGAEQCGYEFDSNIPHSRGFRLGAPEGGALFDPTVRGLAKNDTYDVDRELSGWIDDVSVKHERPFLGHSTAKGTKDHSYLSGHPQFPYRTSPYGPSERILVTTQHHNTVGNGYRPDCQHLHHPLRLSNLVTHRASLTDRNPNYHSIQDPRQLCTHNCREEKDVARQLNHTVFTGAQAYA